MEVKTFTADDLFQWLIANEDFLLLDVRNDVEFGRFKVEGPYPIDMVNVPYMEFIEHEEESVARVPDGKKVRIVCAKEGSAKFVGEILVNHGYEDVASMLSGIKAWGKLYVECTGYREAYGARYPKLKIHCDKLPPQQQTRSNPSKQSLSPEQADALKRQLRDAGYLKDEKSDDGDAR